MRKRFLYMGLITMLFLCLTACFSKDEEAERTPDVDFYIQYASERFDVPADEISVVYFQKGTSVQGNKFFPWDEGIKIIIPPVARLEWGGKTVTFSYSRYIDFYDTTYLRDDYYYDELYEGVRQYFRDRLEVEDVIVVLDEAIATSSDANYVFYGIRDYIASRDVTEVTTDVVEDLIDWVGDEDTWLFVELAGDDLEAEIRALIDSLVAMDRWIKVIVVSQLDKMEVRREVPNPYEYVGFDMLYIYGYGYDIRMNIIEKANGRTYDTRVEYNGYSYSRINPPQAPKQTDVESVMEPVLDSE